MQSLSRNNFGPSTPYTTAQRAQSLGFRTVKLDPNNIGPLPPPSGSNGAKNDGGVLDLRAMGAQGNAPARAGNRGPIRRLPARTPVKAPRSGGAAGASGGGGGGFQRRPQRTTGRNKQRAPTSAEIEAMRNETPEDEEEMERAVGLEGRDVAEENDFDPSEAVPLPTEFGTLERETVYGALSEAEEEYEAEKQRVAEKPLMHAVPEVDLEEMMRLGPGLTVQGRVHKALQGMVKIEGLEGRKEELARELKGGGLVYFKDGQERDNVVALAGEIEGKEVGFEAIGDEGKEMILGEAVSGKYEPLVDVRRRGLMQDIVRQVSRNPSYRDKDVQSLIAKLAPAMPAARKEARS